MENECLNNFTVIYSMVIEIIKPKCWSDRPTLTPPGYAASMA